MEMSDGRSFTITLPEGLILTLTGACEEAAEAYDDWARCDRQYEGFEEDAEGHEGMRDEFRWAKRALLAAAEAAGYGKDD